MKYCVNFHPNLSQNFLNEVDEINVSIERLKTLDDIVEFCGLHSSQRINLCIDECKEEEQTRLQEIFKIQQEHPEYKIYIRIPSWVVDADWFQPYKETYPEAKYYFNDYVRDWDDVWYFMGKGVTDLFVVEGLGFELEQLAAVAHPRDVRIRVFPNVAQASKPKDSVMLLFWIRPEDIVYYEEFVDVCEFFYNTEQEVTKQQIYYDIYAKDKKWLGNLKDLILGFNADIDSTRLVPRFAQRRTKCGRKCMKGANCKMCERIIELSDLLAKTPLRVMYNTVIEEPKEEREDELNG